MNCPTCGFAFVLSNVCYKCPTVKTPNIVDLSNEYASIVAKVNLVYSKEAGDFLRVLFSKLTTSRKIIWGDGSAYSPLPFTSEDLLLDTDHVKFGNLILLSRSNKADPPYIHGHWEQKCGNHYHLVEGNKNLLCFTQRFLGTAIFDLENQIK